jgi:hypothetical protein
LPKKSWHSFRHLFVSSCLFWEFEVRWGHDDGGERG